MAPPFLAALMSRDSNFHPTLSANGFRDQWIHPGDVFSVLLILGSDVVARALAQVAGSRPSIVAFSFGMSSKSVCNAYLVYKCSANCALFAM